MMNILSQASITGIIAVGLTFVILTAEIDLSVAAIANAIGIHGRLLHHPARLCEASPICRCMAGSRSS
jgi:ribose/xylose/arabinose/galactoside ABC-type transport system permease subunit